MITRMRILPLIIVVAGLALALRIGPITSGLSSVMAGAEAQEEQPTGDPASQQPMEDASPAAMAEDQPDNVMAPVTDPLLMSRSELDLLQDLAERRAQLDERQRQQDMRERLLEATEQRIDSKISRLEQIEAQITTLVARHDQQENEQLESLVKVYAAMKAKDAAAILEKLDIDIQMKVATRMKEAKMAPIMAAMTPEAARKLTVEMAEQAALPPIEG